MRDILVLQGVFGGGWGAGAGAPPPPPAAVTVFRHPHHPTIPTFGRVLWMALLLFCILPSSVQADGYLKLGMWPRHNEDVLDVHGGINKYQVELSQRFRIKWFEVEVNPKFMAGGNWPKYTKDWGYEWVYLENNVIFRIFATDELHLFYHKKRYHDLYTKKGARECNCTYANEIGLQFNW